MKADRETIDGLLGRLFPICRSITGKGLRRSLEILKQETPELEIESYASGTEAFDWRIPDEWNIRDAWIKNESGEKIVDFQVSNVHVVSYSEPVQKTISFEELRPHLHSLPALPDAIPYRTSYYKRNWGFCLKDEQLKTLDPNQKYEVYIDSDFSKGELNLASAEIKGSSSKARNYFFSTYLCHPSLANDNLSGPLLAALLFHYLKERGTNHNYRFVIAPETIGVIAYLSRHTEMMRDMEAGFVLTTCAGPGPFGYKESFLKDHPIDRAVRATFRERGVEHLPYPFVPDGSDERQYSSPGFRLPVGTITKDKYYEYDYYHTSKDDLDFISASNLLQTFELYKDVIEKIDEDRVYVSDNPNCEVQLGKRGLYPNTGGAINQSVAGDAASSNADADASDVSETRLKEVEDADEVDAITWLLFLADGDHSLMDMSERSGVPFAQLRRISRRLLEENLIQEAKAK